MNYKFCNFTKEKENGIFEILNESFEVTEFEEILSCYDTFRENFYNPEMPLKFKTIKREFLKPRSMDKPFQGKFQNLDYHVGVDLPILLSPEKKSDKTVLKIAEDPLRQHILSNEEIIFSTPFGTHLKDCREKKLKVYWEITKNLLDNGYNVYLTDILKLC